jgi:hypothetical protein
MPQQNLLKNAWRIDKMKVGEYLKEGKTRTYSWFVEYYDKGKTKRWAGQLGKNIEDMYKEFEKTTRLSRDVITRHSKTGLGKKARTKYQRDIDQAQRDEDIAKWLAGK